MESASDHVSPSQQSSLRAPEQLRFNGNGTEYFGIWIVNLLLTIITLGIYTAWAKVRRMQYFYRHTEVAGSSFDFHGNPIRILIGRLIALAMLFAYSYSARISSWLFLVTLAVLAVVMPWLLRNSLRFRLYNTSWRGTRFHFRGSIAGAYRVFLLNGFLMVITLYLLGPFMHQRLKAYQHDNSWFGRTRCSFHAGASQFYLLYLLLLAAILAIGFLIGITGLAGAFAKLPQTPGGKLDPRAALTIIVIVYGVIILMMATIAPAFRAMITNLIWNNTCIGEHRITCNISAATLVWITFTNLVLVVLTLGLFTPWASVRLAKFQLESVTLLPASDLQEFVAAEPETLGAIGEEAASAFDFDIAL